MATGQLRRGKWTLEEERYVERVIQDFNSGVLAAPAGTTLRNYLSEKLNCDPMRITKKFTGDASIGKRVFRPSEIHSTLVIERARRECDDLERAFRSKLERQSNAASTTSSDALNVRGGRGGHQQRLGSISGRNSVVRGTGEDDVLSEEDSVRVESWLRAAREALQGADSAEVFDEIIGQGEELRQNFQVCVSAETANSATRVTAGGHHHNRRRGGSSFDEYYYYYEDEEPATSNFAAATSGRMTTRGIGPSSASSSSISSASSRQNKRRRPEAYETIEIEKVASDEEATSLLVGFLHSAHHRKNNYETATPRDTKTTTFTDASTTRMITTNNTSSSSSSNSNKSSNSGGSMFPSSRVQTTRIVTRQQNGTTTKKRSR